jgi:hypothetical protein
MRVLFTKGRLEPVSQNRILKAAPALRRGPRPTYFYSSIFYDLKPACEARGWEVETFFVGASKPQQLKRPDIIVNLISEPLLCGRALNRLDEFIRENPTPVMNSVEATRRSSRLALGRILSNVETETGWKVHVPLTTRFTDVYGALPNHVAAQRHTWPVLVRPPGIHGGRGMRRIENPEALGGDPAERVDLLVTDFVDYRDSDGHFQKYRMIWADGRLFRRHRIFSEEWNVGGEARVHMLDRPKLIEAEKEFLSSSNDELDDLVGQLFQAIGLNLGLIDFSVSDEKVLSVFELNGSFQISSSIPEEKMDVWGYLEENNSEIMDAILAGIERRGGN